MRSSYKRVAYWAQNTPIDRRTHRVQIITCVKWFFDTQTNAYKG